MPGVRALTPLGLVVDDGIKGERLKVLKFVNKYLVNLEDEEAKAKYTQVYGYFKANQIKVEDDEGVVNQIEFIFT